MERIDRTSPFSPGKPVQIDFFVGRGKEIERIRRSMAQVTRGKNENLFILGDRGLGKSSLANYCSKIADLEYDLFTVYCSLGGVSSLNEFTKKVLENLIKTSPDKDIIDAFKSFFKKYIRETGLSMPGFFSVKFQATNEELEGLKSEFLPIIAKTIETVKKYGRMGLFLILDDMNDITKIHEFSFFLKSLVDKIAIEYGGMPVLLMLIGVNERRNELIEAQPSVGRIFDIIQLERLNKEEAARFFIETFNSVGIKVEDNALDELISLSSGYPMFMHEVGDAVFWADEDEFISREDAYNGAVIASENIGHKYLDSQIYEAIKSEKYHSILRKIGTARIENRINREFHKNEIKELGLSDSEKKVLDNFLNKMKTLGFIITIHNKQGYRKFANELYELYAVLQSLEREPKS